MNSTNDETEKGKKLKIKKRFINSRVGKKQLRRRKNVSSYNLFHFFLLVKEKLVVGVVTKSQAGIVEAVEGNPHQMEVPSKWSINSFRQIKIMSAS